MLDWGGRRLQITGAASLALQFQLARREIVSIADLKLTVSP